jgi:hypothetical protein
VRLSSFVQDVSFIPVEVDVGMTVRVGRNEEARDRVVGRRARVGADLESGGHREGDRGEEKGDDGREEHLDVSAFYSSNVVDAMLDAVGGVEAMSRCD